MRRPMQLGQIPRDLHENGIRRVSPQLELVPEKLEVLAGAIDVYV